MRPLSFWTRPLHFQTLAKRKEEDNSLTKDNNAKQQLKKGLFIYSSKELLCTEIDYLQNKLISFVVKEKEKEEYNGEENEFNFLSQLDRIDCELLDDYENILNDYDILFVGQLVGLSEKLLLQLKNLMDLQRVAIVFFNASDTKLAYQLNLLKEPKKSENYYGQTIQLNLKNLSQLHSLTLQNFKTKHYNILNNFEQNSYEWIDVNLNDKFLQFFNPENITNREAWNIMLKFNENYGLLLHKEYKILCCHWKGPVYVESPLSNDLFDYFIKYLLFEYKISNENTQQSFRNKLLFCCGNFKLIDIVISVNSL